MMMTVTFDGNNEASSGDAQSPDPPTEGGMHLSSHQNARFVLPIKKTNPKRRRPTENVCPTVPQHKTGGPATLSASRSDFFVSSPLNLTLFSREKSTESEAAGVVSSLHT